MTSANQIVGRRGRVTGTVRPGGVGEVTLPLAQGSNAFLALPSDGISTFKVGVRVVVTEFSAPQTVYVEEDVQDADWSGR